jgi:hypothetical protein
LTKKGSKTGKVRVKLKALYIIGVKGVKNSQKPVVFGEKSLKNRKSES